MSINQVKYHTFNNANFEKWQEAAAKTLRGSIDSLSSETYEGISLSPIYTQKDIEAIPIDQFPGNVRGFAGGWKIAQINRMTEWADLKKALISDLERGGETIAFDADALSDVNTLSFQELEAAVDLTSIPLFITSKYHDKVVVNKLLDSGNASYMGVAATDILSSHLTKGRLFKLDSRKWQNWHSSIFKLNERHRDLKTILIDTVPYQMSGANAVQELGIALAEAVFYIEYMREKGWKPEKTAAKMVFHFSIGGHFFTEIAKLRAFRKLWKTVADAYEIAEHRVFISAETSPFTKSVLDPYVNLLRAGNEAFAAVLGGIDFLHVAPFDELHAAPNDFSMRTARNTQLLLKEESYLNKVIDPAGGSYYIESLTAQLVDEGWRFFQAIDANKGIYNSLESGWLQQKIKEIQKKRVADIGTRKKSMIGVNVYAQIDEQLAALKQNERMVSEEDTIQVEPLSSIRLAAGFERLRELSSKAVTPPTAGLICLGNLKEYKQKADFVTGVLAAGGIRAQWSRDCQSLDDVRNFIVKEPNKYYCICATADYDEWLPEVVRFVKDHVPDCIIELAGKFTEDELQSYEVDGSIYAGQNMYEKLQSLLDVLEVAEDEQ